MTEFRTGTVPSYASHLLGVVAVVSSGDRLFSVPVEALRIVRASDAGAR